MFKRKTMRIRIILNTEEICWTLLPRTIWTWARINITWAFLQGIENDSIHVTWVWAQMTKNSLHSQILSDFPYLWNCYFLTIVLTSRIWYYSIFCWKTVTFTEFPGPSIVFMSKSWWCNCSKVLIFSGSHENHIPCLKSIFFLSCVWNELSLDIHFTLCCL